MGSSTMSRAVSIRCQYGTTVYVRLKQGFYSFTLTEYCQPAVNRTFENNGALLVASHVQQSGACGVGRPKTFGKPCEAEPLPHE